MGIGNAHVNRLDAINGQDIAGGFARKFVGAVRGADGNGERIHTCFADEVRCFIRVSQQLLARHRRVGTVAILFVTFHGLQRAQTA